MSAFTLLDAMTQDGYQPKFKTASQYGGEYSSPCPWDGGTDMFSIHPHRQNDNGTYTGGRGVCRNCNRSLDLIQYLREFRGMTFRDACETAGIDMPDRALHHYKEPVKQRTTFQPEDKPLPPGQWQKQAAEIQKECQTALWANEKILDWLNNERGLSDAAIQTQGLGWNDRDRYFDLQQWGLPAEANRETGRPRKVFVPKGLMIPHWVDGKLIQLRIRRPEGDPRYWLVKGSANVPMTITGKANSAWLVCESVLDGILAFQAAGDLLNIAVMGSTTGRPDISLHDRLTQAETILMSFDSDTAGVKAAHGFWAETYKDKYHRLPPVGGKDVTDMHNAGISVREWAECGLQMAGGTMDDLNPEPVQEATGEPPQVKEWLPGHTCEGHLCDAAYRFNHRLVCAVNGRPIFDMDRCPKNHWLAPGKPSLPAIVGNRCSVCWDESLLWRVQGTEHWHCETCSPPGAPETDLEFRASIRIEWNDASKEVSA